MRNKDTRAKHTTATSMLFLRSGKKKGPWLYTTECSTTEWRGRVVNCFFVPNIRFHTVGCGLHLTPKQWMYMRNNLTVQPWWDWLWCNVASIKLAKFGRVILAQYDDNQRGHKPEHWLHVVHTVFFSSARRALARTAHP